MITSDKYAINVPFLLVLQEAGKRFKALESICYNICMEYLHNVCPAYRSINIDLLDSVCTGSLLFCVTAGHGDNHGFYLEESLEKDWRSFHKTLDHFPHSFQLEDQQQLSVNTCKKVLRTVQADLQAGLPTPLETARALNLLAYLHFQLGRPRESLEHTEQALQQEGEERNVVSLGNRAAMLWLSGERSRAREQVRDLENLRNDDGFGYLMVRARAELAFSYTRLGGQFAPKAVQISKEVIADGREPEVWLWKFGLALTERRVAHLNYAPVLTTDEEDARLLEVLRILLEVIENCRSQNLKAKAYSEVAHLLQGRRGSKSQAEFEQVAQLDPVKACYKALELDSNDSSVLWKCGKIFRYANLLDKSCKLLRKSVDLRPTTAEYHHLGLVYKILATRQKHSRQSDWGGTGRGENQRGRPRGSRRCDGYNQRGRGGRGREQRWDTAKRCEGESSQRGGRGGGECWEAEGPERRGRGGRGRRGRGWYERGNRPPDSTEERMYFRRGNQCNQGNRNERVNRGRGRAQFNNGSYNRLCHSNQYGSLGGRRSGGDWSDLGACGGSESQVLGPSVAETQRRWKSDREGDSGYMTETENLSFLLARHSLDVDSSPTDTGRSPTESWGTPAVTHKNGSSRNFSEAHPTKEAGSEPKDTSAKYERTPSREKKPRDIRSFQRIVKSPSRDAVRFSRTDPFVQEAMDAFEKAVELSEGENIPAVYDLALMHRALDELEEALKLLDTIQQARLKSMGPFYKINAYEQAGLILKDMSETERDQERRKKLNEEGESKLNMALYLCSSLCSRLPGLQHFIRDVWHAFPTLLQAAQHSDRHHTDKLREKARLYQLIKDHWQSMALLQDIRNIDPKAAESPDYLKMCIENYVSLEHYDKALAFIKTLKCTAQGSALDLFEDDQYVQKVYVLAGRAALLKATSADKSNEAREYFSTAFSDAHSTDSDGASSSEDTESVDDGGDDDSWDVMLLHEDSAEVKAKVLSDVLQSACGLKVTRMGEDCLPGRLYLDSIMRIMSRSRQVVVLAGAPKVTAELRLLLEKAARKPATVALLMEGDHVPKVMKTTNQRRSGSRSMVCPEELLIQGADGGGGGAYSHTKVQAVCDVFSFLIDIPSVSPHQGANCL